MAPEVTFPWAAFVHMLIIGPMEYKLNLDPIVSPLPTNTSPPPTIPPFIRQTCQNSNRHHLPPSVLCVVFIRCSSCVISHLMHFYHPPPPMKPAVLSLLKLRGRLAQMVTTALNAVETTGQSHGVSRTEVRTEGWDEREDKWDGNQIFPRYV